MSARPVGAVEPAEGGALRGIGLELVEVPRFARALERFGDRLLARIFTPDEIAYGRRKRRGEQNLAARFAAKCAGRRALRARGLRVGLRDLEIVRRRTGEPTLVLRTGGGAPEPREPRPLTLAVSLTHDADFAMASVWLEAAR